MNETYPQDIVKISKMRDDEIKTFLTKKGISLTVSEARTITKKLSRDPGLTELYIFDAEWSEHCSYKSSKPVIKLLHTTGKQVIQGPGENAGIVDIGDGLGVVFKMESHNHPSAIEPYEAAATGGGGCMRDIFTMGARPIALLNSLRFGKLSNKRVKYLFKEIGKGFSDYANVVGVPVVGGEVYFDESYEGNPLVNAMTVGIVKHENIVRAKASGVGNVVAMIGGDTGRDGVGGASFASGGLKEGSEEKTSAVAIGDPEMGKRLREGCLDLSNKKLVVGMQDMGAAGLVCSTSETAYKGRTGIEIELTKVRQREKGMAPAEIMVSESQERMLVILEKDKIEEVRKVLDKWSVPMDIVGKVTEDGILRIKENGKVVAEIPAEMLAKPPVYTREEREPDFSRFRLNIDDIKEPRNYNDALLKLLSSPTIASKKVVYSKSDEKSFKNVLVKPGEADAAIVRIEGTNKGIGMVTDCNATYCLLNPRRGSRIAVAEAARNLVCVGVKPLGVTDCLNFGNPMDPEVFWSFKKCMEGISDACKALDIPVVSGNVSLYNESPKGSVDPTPSIGMVGILEDVSKHVTQSFKDEGNVILLLGETKEELGGSEYLKVIHSLKKGDTPEINLEKEGLLQKAVLEIVKQNLAKSCHDCSEGGLSVALAESCISGKIGARVNIETRIRKDALLFGESQSRIIVSCSKENVEKIKNICEKERVPVSEIGVVGNDKLSINRLIDIEVDRLLDAWEGAIEKELSKK